MSFPWRLWAVVGFLFLFLILNSSARAGSNTVLRWDASPEPEVVAYNIYYGTKSYNYNQIVTVGNVTSASVAGLAAGGTYFFAVTALSAFGEESDFSNEAIYVVPVVEPKLQVTPLANGTVQLAGTGEVGHAYRIQTTSDFFSWTTLTTQTADVEGAFAFVDTQPTTYPAQFYRLQDLGSAAMAAVAKLQLSAGPNQVMNLTAAGLAGNTYEIQATADLKTWVAIGTRSADLNGDLAFTDYDAPNFPSRYYRLNNLTLSASLVAVQLSLSADENKFVTLTGIGQASRTYEIQASTDLKNWTPIGFQTADANGAFIYTDYAAPSYPARFYRTLDSQP